MHTVKNITSETIEAGGQTFEPGVEVEVDARLWGFLTYRASEFEFGPITYQPE